MSNFFITPISASIAAITTFGILLHDTQLDQLAVASVVPVSAVVGYAAVDIALRSSEKHLHVERPATATVQQSALRLNLPKIQPRDDMRRYIQVNKLALEGNNGSIWPSA